MKDRLYRLLEKYEKERDKAVVQIEAKTCDSDYWDGFCDALIIVIDDLKKAVLKEK